MKRDQCYYNLIFRTICKKSGVCYIQNYDQNKKPFMGIELSPFEFLVFSEATNRNYIVEVIGNSYPTFEKENYKKNSNFEIDGLITYKKEERRIELEHTLIWQNMFKGEFESILAFIYIFENDAAEQEFKKRMNVNAMYFNFTEKNLFHREKIVHGAICSLPSRVYLEYANENKIPREDMKFQKDDGPKYLKNIQEFIPDVSPI